MTDEQNKAFEFAADLTKQLITLATAILTLSVGFLKDITENIKTFDRYLLIFIWILFLLSIIFGILTLMALTGNLDPLSKKNSGVAVQVPPVLTITSSNVTFTAKFQIILFVIALGATCYFGYLTISKNELSNHKNSYMVVRQSRLGKDTTSYIDTLYLHR
ncbi:MAG: hypothetical protein ACJ748_12935 [Flavisolibacter sp.]